MEDRAQPPWSWGKTALQVQLQAIRAERFADGIRCPRCGETRVTRWGHFGARQRYRCKVCRRTFSDLTGTPAAYSKKLLLWSAYARCMAEGLTVRKSAARVGIATTTAFRWRHALLDELRAGSDVKLSGWVEFAWSQMAWSNKGQRPRHPGANATMGHPRAEQETDKAAAETAEGSSRAPARKTRRQRWLRGYRLMYEGRRVTVVFACDRHGSVHAGVCPLYRPTLRHLKKIYTGRFEGEPVLVAKHGGYGPIALLARRLEVTHQDERSSARQVSPPITHRNTVIAYRFRFFDWMTRFFGVATKYLPNYLIWHDHVDRAFRNAPSRTMLRWPVAV